MPFQPRKVVMAPRGHIHFHPDGDSYCEDFSAQNLQRQGLFIHEMVHVWQAQVKGSWWLVLNRMPWTPYHYSLKPGWPLERYEIEQQAEIVKHAFWLRNGVSVPGAGNLEAYRLLVNFLGTD